MFFTYKLCVWLGEPCTHLIVDSVLEFVASVPDVSEIPAHIDFEIFIDLM